jgi:ABC-2 type transport system ATP-binding protein
METASPTAIVSLRGVTKRFGDKAAVADVDITVMPGEIFGFLGPNGAGKTTAIKLILDILRPTSGRIELFGLSNRLTTVTHQRLGYLSGDMVLDDDLTGQQYLRFIAGSYGGNYDDRIKLLAAQLEADLDVRIGNYSRGNKQKIGLIAAMMHQPELLILDEPSSGFDPLMQEVFIRLIGEYRRQGGTVFMSSHTLGEVQRLCDRAAFIRAGSIVGVKNIDELSQSSAKRVEALAGRHDVAGLVQKAKRVSGLRLVRQDGARLSFRYDGDVQPLLRFFAAFTLEDLTIQEPELEEIFMSYYQDTAAAK